MMRMTALVFLGLTTSVPALAQTEAAMVTNDEAEQRVESILGQMTLEEKIDLIAGVDFFTSPIRTARCRDRRRN